MWRRWRPSLGMAFEPLFNTPREQCPLSDDATDRGREHRDAAAARPRRRQLRGGAAAGRQPPPGRAARRPATSMAQRIRITSTARLHDFVARHSAREIERRAVDELRDEQPELSAGVSRLAPAATSRLMPRWPLLAAIAVPARCDVDGRARARRRVPGLDRAAAARPPQRAPSAPAAAYILRRMAADLFHRRRALSRGRRGPGLVAALRALDYPPEKLDIKLVVEPDDRETREALSRTRSSARRSRSSSRRTAGRAPSRRRSTPRCRSCAAHSSRCSTPRTGRSPTSFGCALEAFVANDERLACVQARLTIDNTADSWLTRLFTAEYAGLFDVFLPGLAAWRLPLPLGGSSNHFRTDGAAADRRLGPLQRHRGCRSRHAARALRLSHRRDRIDHLRGGAGALRPLAAAAHALVQGLDADLAGAHALRRVRLSRELGLAGFAVFQLLVGGTVLAALVHVLFAAAADLDAGDDAAGRRAWPARCSASMPRRWCPAI